VGGSCQSAQKSSHGIVHGQKCKCKLQCPNVIVRRKSVHKQPDLNIAYTVYPSNHGRNDTERNHTDHKNAHRSLRHPSLNTVDTSVCFEGYSRQLDGQIGARLDSRCQSSQPPKVVRGRSAER